MGYRMGTRFPTVLIKWKKEQVKNCNKLKHLPITDNVLKQFKEKHKTLENKNLI